MAVNKGDESKWNVYMNPISSKSSQRHLFFLLVSHSACPTCPLHNTVINPKSLLVTIKPITTKANPPSFVITYFLFIVGFAEENRTVVVFLNASYGLLKQIKMKYSAGEYLRPRTHGFTQRPTHYLSFIRKGNSVMSRNESL